MTANNGETILVVGSVALDEIATPFGRVEEIIGGAGVYFSAAASLFGKVHLVGVVGEDYPLHELSFLEERGVELGGLQHESGPSFRWGGVYDYAIHTRETTHTRLGVFADFQPDLPVACQSADEAALGQPEPR
jgi:hypothetical protein